MIERPDPEFYLCKPVWHRGAPVVEDVDWHRPTTESEERLASGQLATVLTFGAPTRVQAWISGGGKRWPNLLGGWREDHQALVHERVAERLRASPLRGYELSEVELGLRVGLKPLPNGSAPKYFVLKALGNMDFALRIYERLDDGRKHEFLFATKNLPEFLAHPRQKEISAGYGRYPKRRIPLQETWDGADFFALGKGQCLPSAFYCTRAFLDFVRAENWSGFAFHPLDALGESWTDFRKRPWPPSRWYPPSQPD